jgi:uncharacterized protein involved in exopolysaccharide biosynthesis
MVNGTPDTLPDLGAEAEAAGPDLRDLFVRGLSRSLPWVVAFTVIGMLAGLWVGVTQPNLFVSNTKLLLRVGARELVSSESMIGPEDESRVSGPTMFDEIQMLSDVAIFQKVALTVGPQEILRAADPSRDDDDETPAHTRLLHSFQSSMFGSLALDHDCPGATCTTCLRQATKELVTNTSIDSEMGSNVILVSYVSTSPEKAQKITQALADAFIERHREQFSIQALVEKNRGKVEQAKRERDEAAAAYIDHLNRTGLAGGDTLNPLLITELHALDKELFDAKSLRAEIQQKRASLTERAQNEPPPLVPVGPSLMVPNTQYEAQLELKRNFITQRRNLAPSNVVGAKELDARIAAIDEVLSRMPRVVTQAADSRELMGSTAGLHGRLDLEVDENSLDVRIQMLTERYNEKKAAADDLRRSSLTVDLERSDLADARDNAENRYKQMQDRFAVLEALSAIDINEDANLRVLQAPTLERDKVGPKRLSLLLKGMIAGFLAGAVFAVMRQRIDRRLRYPELFEAAHGLPVLGVVPQVAGLRRLPRGAGEPGRA